MHSDEQGHENGGMLMFDPYKFSIASLGVLIAFLVGGITAYAVLPPGASDRLKKDAEEVLKVKILNVEIPDGKKDMFSVFYTAQVLGVKHSKSGVQKGDKIRIRSYFVTKEALRKGFVGPKVPPLLCSGWVGIAYLNAIAEKKVYAIAAYGHSFDEADKDQSEK